MNCLTRINPDTLHDWDSQFVFHCPVHCVLVATLGSNGCKVLQTLNRQHFVLNWLLEVRFCILQHLKKNFILKCHMTYSLIAVFLFLGGATLYWRLLVTLVVISNLKNGLLITTSRIALANLVILFFTIKKLQSRFRSNLTTSKYELHVSILALRHVSILALRRFIHNVMFFSAGGNAQQPGTSSGETPNTAQHLPNNFPFFCPPFPFMPFSKYSLL